MGTNSMHVAKTGLNAQQRRMQVIANNLQTLIQQDLKEKGKFWNITLPSIKK